MAKKKTIIKKPVGNGNISITIENNLKNTNPVPPPVKRRRRRKQLPTTDETNSMIENMLRGGSATGGGGGNLPPLKDVSYIKPPSNNFTVWRDNFNDSYNTTIPQGQAQQMGMLPLPKVEAPPHTQPQQQLALTAPPVVQDNNNVSLKEFMMFMAGQGQSRQGPQNLHEDPYNDNEPMDDRYTNLRPSSRIEEVEADVLKEAGATEEQINNYQQQIQQHKAINTTNEQKLASAGLNPEIIQNVEKIAAIKTAGTWQGKRNIKPDGPYIKDPNFIASYNAARADRLSKEPSERETAINRNKKYTLLGEGEDPWDNLDADPQQPEDIFYDAKTQTEEEKDAEEMKTMRERLVNVGLRKDNKSEEQRNLEKQNKASSIIAKGFKTQLEARKDAKEKKMKKDLDIEIEKIMKESRSAQLITRAVKGRNARKELRELRELEAIQVNQEEQAGKVITKAAQKYQEKKRKKAWVQKAKADLEAEIAKLQDELKAGSREPRMATSKVINKALESVKDFWQKEMTQEEARQARRDARKAKQDAQQKTEDKLAAKAKALQDRRKQLEALGSAAN